MLVERIENEYMTFKKNILNMSKEEIYNASHKIRFFENLYYYTINNENKEELNKIGKQTLEEMYNKYKNLEVSFDIEKGEDINYLLNFLKV